MSDVCVCMYKHVRLGGSGGMLPQEVLVAQRLRLSPFCDRNRAVVVVHGSRNIASNFWLSVCSLPKPADFEFLGENV